MTRKYTPQPVPQIIQPSASNEILWDLTVADYRAWRKAFYAEEGNVEIELSLLNAILKTSDRLAWRVVWTYLDLLECRPKEMVDPFSHKPRKAS